MRTAWEQYINRQSVTTKKMFNAIGSRLKDTAIAVKDGAIIAAVATKDAAVYTAEVSYDAGVATAAAVNVAVVEPAKEELRVVWEKIDTNHHHARNESMNMALFRTCLDGGVELTPHILEALGRNHEDEVDPAELQLFFVNHACK
jgi:hypothetical protein